MAEVFADGIVVRTPPGALDLLATAQCRHETTCLLYEKNVVPEFFDLKTRFAGAMLQKRTNYKRKLVIIGNFERIRSKG